MAYSRNPTWQDGVEGGTRIDAANLENIEAGIEAAAATADAAQAGLAGKVDVADAVSLAGAGDLPIQNGTAFQGSANVAARADHVHPATVTPTLVTGIPVGNDFHPARTSTTAWTPTIGRTYVQAYPIFTMNRAGLTVSRVTTFVQTAGSADSAVKVALLGSQANGMPDFTNQIIPSTTITTAAATGRANQDLGSSVVLPDGWYWKAFLVTGTTSPGFRSTVDGVKVFMRNPNSPAAEQYSATRVITAVRAAFPANNADGLDYESTNDIAPLILVVV